jgi:hypothetical protein
MGHVSFDPEAFVTSLASANANFSFPIPSLSLQVSYVQLHELHVTGCSSYMPLSSPLRDCVTPNTKASVSAVLGTISIKLKLRRYSLKQGYAP